MPRKPDPNPPKRPRLEAYYCKLCIKDFKTPRGLSAHESRPGHVQKQMEYTRRKRARLVEAEQAARQAAKALRQQESPRRSPRELSHDSQREVGMNALVDEAMDLNDFGPDDFGGGNEWEDDQEADQNQHYSPPPTPSINDIEREPIRDSPDPTLPSRIFTRNGKSYTHVYPPEYETMKNAKPRFEARQIDEEYWKATFPSYADWSITRFLIDVGASRNQMKSLLDTLRDPRFRLEEMEFETVEEIYEALDENTKRAGLQFHEESISLPRGDGGAPIQVKVPYVKLEEKVQEVLSQSHVAAQMHWVPYQQWGETGREWDDFASSDMFWNLFDSHKKKNGFTLGLHIYADASKITTFGNKKVWPVRAWISNLPYKTRIDRKLTGSSLIGYIPVIDDLVGKEQRDTTWFRTAKRELYHRALAIILKPLMSFRDSGFMLQSGDGVEPRRVFFAVNCISADLLEFFEMYLTRGTNSHFPCVICKVPNKEQHDLSKVYPLWTVPKRRAVIFETRILRQRKQSKAAAKLLTANSMHNKVATVFELPQDVDIHLAISNDDIHRDLGGNWGRHVFPLLMEVAQHGSQLDARLASFPPFPDLRSFSSGITKAKWVDASTYGDLHKIFLASAPGTLGKFEKLLLILARYWAILYHFDNLHTQTEQTLKAIELVLLRISTLMERVHQLFGMNIDYPKMHLLVHLTLRYRLHGASRITSTRIGEVLHKMDHWFYRKTNKRNVMPQLTQQHAREAAIRRIEALEAELEYRKHFESTSSRDGESVEFVSPKTTVSSKRNTQARTLQSIVNDHRNETLWIRFEFKLRLFLTNPALANTNDEVAIRQQDLVGTSIMTTYYATQHQLIRVPYFSYKTQDYVNDLVRCTPDFHRRERFDYVMFHDPRKPENSLPSFGRLLLVFTLDTQSNQDALDQQLNSLGPLAFVQEFIYLGRDNSTWLPQLQRTSNSHFIPVSSIIRAVSLPPVPKSQIEVRRHTVAQMEDDLHYLNELIDCDSYHRISQLFPIDDDSLVTPFFDNLKLEIDQHQDEAPVESSVGRRVDETADLDEEERDEENRVSRTAGEDGEEDLIPETVGEE